MKLRLSRIHFGANYTVGVLFIDEVPTGVFTLEDKVREKPGVPVSEWKIPGKTAIPAGTYKAIVSFSNRFQRELPLLVGVPGFTGVRIHTGNTDADTEGCILVGNSWVAGDFIHGSRAAFEELFPKIKAAGSVEITVG